MEGQLAPFPPTRESGGMTYAPQRGPVHLIAEETRTVYYNT